MPTQAEHEVQADYARQALVRLVRARGPGIKLPTVLEMCAELQISRTKLDQALLSLEQGGLIRRRRGSGIYGTDRVARKTIGVVFGGDIFSPGYSPFWSLLLQAVRGEAGAHNFSPQAYMDISEGQEGLGGHSQLVEDLEAHRLDGLLLLAPQYAHDEAAELRAYGVPLVVFGGQASEDWCVVIDWTGVLRLAAAELARQGSRHIGVLAPPSERAILEELLRGAGADGVRIDDWSYETWAEIIPYVGSHEQCARVVMERKLAEAAGAPLPDTLVSLEDTATRGVIEGLHRAGLHPGRDIRIITAANKGSPVLEPYAADITRVALDPAVCIKAALGMLDTLMNGGTPKENPVWVRAGEGSMVDG